MKKRIISSLLALCMALVLLPTAALADDGGWIEDPDGEYHYLLAFGKDYAVSGDGWSWDGKGVLTLSGCTGKTLSLGYTTKVILAAGSVNNFERVRLSCIAGVPTTKIEGTGELIATSRLSIFQDTGPVILADNLQMTGGTGKDDLQPLTYDTNLRGLREGQIPKTSSGIEATYVRIGPASSADPGTQAQPGNQTEKGAFADVSSGAYYHDAVA